MAEPQMNKRQSGSTVHSLSHYVLLFYIGMTDLTDHWHLSCFKIKGVVRGNRN